ncbi:MAG: hypothetical protein IIC69_01625 [Nanoarchaeota archaeon]|nr:hypothetical protein [Nanoarchaeota archaeon]
MTQINLNLLLQNFLNKNPDIRESRNKGLVNRRALAKYIIEKESLDKNRFEALVTTLRRFELKPETLEYLDVVKELKVSTKDKISIVYLEKSDEVLKNILKVVNLVNFNKSETLKIVLGSLSIKLFIDEFNVKKTENIFSDKDIIATYKNISELNLIFPDKASKMKGVIAYITTELSINNINIVEIITGKPELIIYVKESELLKAYETINRLKE